MAEFELAEVGTVGGGELGEAAASVAETGGELERTDRFARRGISRDARQDGEGDVVEGSFRDQRAERGHDHAGQGQEVEIGRWVLEVLQPRLGALQDGADMERKRQVAELVP